MPMATVALRPGINVELTPAQNSAGYSVSSLIRWRQGLAQKLGGWTQFYGFALNGIPRALHAWQDFSDDQYLGAGTTQRLVVINDGVLTDITPQEFVSDFAPDFDTTNTSPDVTVNDPNIANVTTFDAVEFLTPVSVGGVILSGVYPIDLVLGTTDYRIVAATNATANVTAGGAVPEFTTTSGSATVSVELEDHGLSAGDNIVFPMATTVGGVTIEGTYAAVAISSVDVFTISVDELASSSTSAFMNGGDVRIVYRIALGPVAASTGYGIGTYGSGGYGTGTSSSAQTGTPITATDWSLDNWTQTFLASPEGGGIYAWTPNTGFLNAKLVAGGPAYNESMFVSSRAQILVALGSTQQEAIGVQQDPLLVKWSDQLDYTFWEIGATNPSGELSQAGQYRLSTGSRIVAGLTGPQQDLIWTDLDLWAMNYVGLPEKGITFGFNKIAGNCGLIGKHAFAQQGGNIFWMGASNFYVMGGNGVPAAIPCTVWDTVFQDLNRTYEHKCWAWSNSPFNEIWFFWPRASTGATECDAFVKLNTLEPNAPWDYGPSGVGATPIPRSCGIDRSVLGMPIAATPAGVLYEHETSANADGQPLVASFTTGQWAISEGQDIAFVDWILPDMKWGNFNGAQTATLQVTFYSYYYAGETPQTHGPYTFTQTTKYLNPRIRGRFISMKVESADLDSFWRLGALKYRAAPDGRYG